MEQLHLVPSVGIQLHPLLHATNATMEEECQQVLAVSIMQSIWDFQTKFV